MKKGQQLLEALVKDEGLRQASKSWPSTEGRKDYSSTKTRITASPSTASSAFPAAKVAFMITPTPGRLTDYSTARRA